MRADVDASGLRDTNRPRIAIVTPAARGSRSGNRTTALRWAGLLRRLGHDVRITTPDARPRCDALLAIHAAHSAECVLAAAAACPRPVVVVLLSGTDVYPELDPAPRTRRALDVADALVVLQPNALAQLPPDLRTKAHVVLQSARPIEPAPPRSPVFRAAVLAHLRPVKRPLLPLEALARLGRDWPGELAFAGRAIDSTLGERLQQAAAVDPRVRWLGDLRRREALTLLASSHLCIVPSAAEGGANVISEAIACGTPVVCSDIPGNVGLVGDDWPALFPLDDDSALAAILRVAAQDPGWWAGLRTRTRALRAKFSPEREQAALRDLLGSLWRTGAGGLPPSCH